MAKTISYGATGEDVRRLQDALKKCGYSVDVDGKFNDKTKNAVIAYQKKNSIAADGIVTDTTWNSLTADIAISAYNSNKAKKTNTTSSGSVKIIKPVGSVTNGRPQYTKSKELTDAENRLSEWKKERPGEYESKYSDKIDEILNDILNRKEFSYNMNADPLYQQYREQYIENGKKAMLDTVGNAAALTGGYANSYAQTAGSEAYNEYLTQLNSLALEFRDIAFDQYEKTGRDMLEDIEILRSLDGEDYEKYLGSIERYYSDGDFLLAEISQMSDAEYKQFTAQVEAWENDRDYDNKIAQQKAEREEFDKKLQLELQQLDFDKQKAAQDQKNKDREYALKEAELKAKTYSSSGSSSGKKSTVKSSNSSVGKSTSTSKTLDNIVPKTYKEFVMKTGYAGILTETEFKSRDNYRNAYGSYENYLKEMYIERKRSKK